MEHGTKDWRRLAGQVPVSRRAVVCGAGGGLGLGLTRAFAANPARRVAAHETTGTVAEAPPDNGQTHQQVYVEATGHTVGGLFLDYWRANGAEAIYGNPISEPFVSPDGRASQAFENGIFQYNSECIHTEEPIVRLMPIGRQFFSDMKDIDASAALEWLPGNADTWAAIRNSMVLDETSDDPTGPIGDELMPWYDMHEGTFYLGSPRSRVVREGRTTAQWFDGGLLLFDTGAEVTRLAPLVRGQAARLGIDTKPVTRGELPLFSEWLFLVNDNPDPHGDPTTPGRKRIEVSLGEQLLRAYQGNTLVTAPLVSTGIDPNGTEVGVFRVRLKYPEQDMRGFTDETGEVIGFGDAPPGTVPYGVKDVPNVIYFNLEAEALHGTYWHDNFGQKMSHGCVNLPLDAAAFLYGWAPLGTQVVVRE